MLKREMKRFELACAAALLGLIAGCGGGGGGTAAPPPIVNVPVTQFAVGGTVTGLEQGGSVTLSNGTEKLAVTANGSFAFPTKLAAGTAFSISASTASGHTCKLSEATGTLGNADSTRTAVACMPVVLAGAMSALQGPVDVAADGKGNLYVVDSATYSVVKFSADGAMSVLAGGSDKPGFVDGPGAQARFRFGRGGIAFDDSGNLLVADSCNGAMRKITPEGMVSTLAGHGTPYCDNVLKEWTGNETMDGVGTAAAFAFPEKLLADGAGGVIVIDSSMSGPPRRVSAAGVVTSDYLMTTTGAMYTGLLTAMARGADGTMYMADRQRIYRYESGMLVALAGSATSGSTDGTGAAARFSSVRDMVVAPGGDLYVVDSSQIRRVTPAGVVSTLAGDGRAGDAVDGRGLAARFSSPMSITLDGNGIVALDPASGLLRRVGFDGEVTTLATPAPSRGSVDGRAGAARFTTVSSLSADAGGNLYVAESAKHVVRKVMPDGTVSTIAGQPGVSGTADGALAGATFNAPRIVVPGRDGSLWVAQSTGLRRIHDGMVTTVDPGIHAAALAIDADGNAIVGTGVSSHELVKITPQGQKTVLVGWQQVAVLSGDQNNWFIPQSVAIDGAGNIYVADMATVAVYKLDKAGKLSLFAGTPLKETGDVDGPANTATLGFYELDYMTIDDKGNLYLSGQGGVRMISPAGVVSSPSYAWGKTPIAAVAVANGKLYGMARYALLQTWLP